MKYVYELTGVSQRFDAYPALTDVNFKVSAAERVALVGPSGAGKSTLIRLLNGTILPTAGDVNVLGKKISQLKPRQMRQLQGHIGTIYQQFHLVDTLRVIHNVNAGRLGGWSLPKSLFSLAWPQEIDNAANALNQVGIPEKIFEPTHQLSGGQQQRVAIARVLVQNPQVILADEPISSLDPERSREIMDLLLKLSQDRGTTLIASLHAIDFALSHFERVIGLRQGNILFDAPADEVSADMIQGLYQIASTG